MGPSRRQILQQNSRVLLRPFARVHKATVRQAVTAREREARDSALCYSYCLDAIARLRSDAQTFVGVAARTGAGPSAGARWRPAPRRAASTSVVMYAGVSATSISGAT